MKKIILITLCVLLIVGAVGCNNKSTPPASDPDEITKTATFASKPRTLNSGTSELRTLNNTYYCLTKEKELNVAFIGGSITVGFGGSKTGGWCALTTEWLEEQYPDATINYTNAGLGGTSSMWGLFRLDNEVMCAKPDLIFIEFAVNDAGFGLEKNQSAAFMDAMIRKINTELPQTDIVLVFTTNEGHLGKDFENLVAHREVAQYYGIPCIDVGKALIEEMEQLGEEWSNYSDDYAHPNNKGYKKYFETVRENLKNMLDEANGAGTKTNHTLNKTPYTSNTPSKVVRLLPKDITYNEDWRYDDSVSHGMHYDTALIAVKKGAKITIEFEGCMIGYAGYVKKNATIKVSIDGKYEKTVTSGSKENGIECLLYDNLAEGKHTLTIEYVSGFFSIGSVLIG